MKTSVFTRIFIPILILLIILIPLSALVFQNAARKAAFDRAEKDFETLQADLDRLISEYFPEGRDAPDKERTNRFLREVSRAQSRVRGDARALIFASEDQLVFPADGQEDPALLTLAEAVLALSREEGAAGECRTVKAGGEDILVRAVLPPAQSRRVALIAVYCPVESIVYGVRSAVIQMTALISALAVVIIAALAVAAKSVSRPLRMLEESSACVARGEEYPLKEEFSLKEAEALRRALKDASEKLRAADRAQKTFFQNVSHELRTPLMSIGGYAQGIEQGVLSDAPAAARVILDESRRLTDMVNELLSLSRLDGESAPELAALDLSTLLQNALERVSGAAAQKGVTISLDTVDGAEVLTTEDLFEKITGNLLSNAVRYAKSRVYVSCAEEDGYVSVTVRDDGEGIAEDDIPHIFERGYKGKNGSFGLGLSIALLAAKACGADLSAENRKDGGAAFVLKMKKA
ncbi:MAG: HAMP domain-containing histidine kinase [Clostridia bacterium]|nr:HAMP domain-containing histidine kinase [Clostridia bacterium]